MPCLPPRTNHSSRDLAMLSLGAAAPQEPLVSRGALCTDSPCWGLWSLFSLSRGHPAPQPRQTPGRRIDQGKRYVPIQGREKVPTSGPRSSCNTEGLLGCFLRFFSDPSAHGDAISMCSSKTGQLTAQRSTHKTPAQLSRRAFPLDPAGPAHRPSHLSSPPNVFLTSAEEVITSTSFPNAN